MEVVIAESRLLILNTYFGVLSYYLVVVLFTFLLFMVNLMDFNILTSFFFFFFFGIIIVIIYYYYCYYCYYLLLLLFCILIPGIF